MANSYYTKSGSYQAGTRARGSEVSDDYDGIVAGFDLLEAVLTKDGDIAANLDGGDTYKLTSMIDGSDTQDYATIANVNAIAAGGGSPGEIPITSLGIGTATALQHIVVNAAGTAIEGVALAPGVTDLGVGTATAGQVIRINDAGSAVIGGFSDRIQDDDGDTKIQVEEGADDDTVRIDCATVEVATFTATTITLAQDVVCSEQLTLSATMNAADQEINRPYFKDLAETLVANGTVASAATLTIDHSTGNVHNATSTADFTVAFSNWPATGRAGNIEFILTNGGTGTVTWPAAVKWADGGSAPQLQASGRDRLYFKTEDAGTTIDAIHRGDFS